MKNIIMCFGIVYCSFAYAKDTTYSKIEMPLFYAPPTISGEVLIVSGWMEKIKDVLEYNSFYDSLSHVVKKPSFNVRIRNFQLKYNGHDLALSVCISDSYLPHKFKGLLTNIIILTPPPEIYSIEDSDFIWDFLIKVLEKKFVFNKEKLVYVQID